MIKPVVSNDIFIVLCPIERRDIELESERSGGNLFQRIITPLFINSLIH